MAGAVIIVHPSDIIRIGISSILENEISVEVLSFSTVDELEKLQPSFYSELVLILPGNCNNCETFKTFRTQTQRLLIIGVTNNNDTSISNEFFDTVFSLYAEKDELIQNTKQFLNFTNTTNDDDELSLREKEVLRLIALGNTNKSIADTLFISTHTVISHRKNITDKLGIKSIPGLTVYAIIQNIISQADIAKDKLI